MSSDFVHLHLHSEFSLVDGLVRLDELVGSKAHQTSKTIALTDQSNLFAMVKFYQAAEAAGIKPIIGVDIWVFNEADLNQPFRLILLCQNEKGYRHLTQLVSRSYTEGQHKGQPQIKKEWIKASAEGLIAIATARHSDIARALLASETTLADSLFDEWIAMFPERFYLEVTRTGRSEEEHYIQTVVLWSERKNAALVATNAVRFLNKEDFEAHEARVCIHESRTVNDPERARVYSEEQYLKTPEEMNSLFADLPESIENTIEIAKRCNLNLQLGKVFLPNYPIAAGQTIEQQFQAVSQKGLLQLFSPKPVPVEYEERLATELAVLNSMGYGGYFLIVADFIQWAKDNKIPVGPGRGSGAGSLVAYALGITGLDPLQYDLLFERFLNPERVSMPDFDIDFCMDGRDKVIDYVAKSYGRDSVSQIITYGTLAAKAVIRDVGRVLGHPYGFVDKIAKLIPLELGITLEKALAQEELLRLRYNEEEEVKNLIDLAKKLEGITRNAGKHAGGVVIAPSKLTDFTPLYCDEEGTLLTQFDKNDVETIGLVKFDFLGLRTLTIIDWALIAVNDIRSKRGETPIDISLIPRDDQKTFDLLRACQTTAVFQLESRGMKDLVKRLQPDNFEEIIALVALFRPGPLQSGMVDDFINRKHGRAQPEYLHPKLTHILKPTYGIILYQEQVMQIAQVLAGYTLGGADLLRRAMGKKKPEEMAKQRVSFVKGAIDRGVDAERASYIFDLMEKFAGYGFNKSHSAAYALLTYQTAWLKTHYKEAFMAAVLSSDMAHTDKVVNFIEECRQMKITILPPDINHSQYQFSVNEDKQILYGLGAIKGVGEAAIASIAEVRKTRKFNDIFDFCARIDTRRVSRRVNEALIRAGAFDSFDCERSFLMKHLEQAILTSEQMAKNRHRGQADLFEDAVSDDTRMLQTALTAVKPWSDDIRLQGEKATLGLYLTGHPLQKFETELACLRTACIRDLRLNTQQKFTIAGLIIAVRTLITRKGDKMAFIVLDDRTGRQEIAIFSEQFRQNKDLLVAEQLVIIEGEVSPDRFTGGLKMRCLNVLSLDDARNQSAKYLKIVIDPEKTEDNFSNRLLEIFKPQQIASGCPVRIVCEQQQAEVTLKLGEDWRIQPKQVLLDALQGVNGIETVLVAY
jgi:DNA polymerase-3 subunit alpha